MAAARFMPGACDVLVSSASLEMIRIPSFFQFLAISIARLRMQVIRGVTPLLQVVTVIAYARYHQGS